MTTMSATNCRQDIASKALTREQVASFWRDGYVVAESAVTPAQLAGARTALSAWVEESRAHQAPFGEPTIDGRPRCDMGAEHTAAQPALRRVNNPSEVNAAYREIAQDALIVDMVADLIGPHLKFHHCKINLKLPGSNTEVAFHQDFAYTPHTNADVVTALLMLDDMTESNGCLRVVPGSHTGSVFSLFEGDRFTGFVSAEVDARERPAAVPVLGKAGDVCLMHTRLLHGSDANVTESPRGLYIAVYTAADAFPIAKNPMPNPDEGRILRGRATRHARLENLSVELPEQPKMASFFAVQEQSSKLVG